MKVIVTGAGGFVGRALLQKIAGRFQILAVDQSLPVMPGAIEPLEGNLADPKVLGRLQDFACDAVIHLATVPGGSAEREPAHAWQVNVEATRALLEATGSSGSGTRFVFASSIAVFGDVHAGQLDESDPVAPSMLYGAHKAMMETWLATLTRRGSVRGVSLRLPGIVARPIMPAGLKSAFLSDVFHAMKTRRPIELPVSPNATTLLMSVEQAAANMVHALQCAATGVVTLPALHVRLSDLVKTLAVQTGSPVDLVTWNPDSAVEDIFGRLPPIFAPSALSKGFTCDSGLSGLVRSALSVI